MTETDGGAINQGWFRKGRSGNPGGRPKRIAQDQPSAFDIIIDKTLTVTRAGTAREITLEEALQQRTYQEALSGKRMAIREVLRWIVKRERWLAKNRPARRAKITFLGMGRDPENADQALLLLGIARENTDRSHLGLIRLQLKLEPWAVKAALKRRRGTRSLTKKQVDDIRRCMHDDGTVRLPAGTDV